MTTGPSIARRLVRLVQRLPESTANSFRFRVPFFLPRWFSVPPEVRVSGKAVKLHFPAGEYAESDFIECFLLNAYGLGHKLGNVRSILDVGANVGFFALAAREYYPDTTIHAYEPNPRVVPLLRANTEGFNVSIYPEAIGSEECFVTVLDEGPSDEARTRRSAESNGAVRQISASSLRPSSAPSDGVLDGLNQVSCAERHNHKWPIPRSRGSRRRAGQASGRRSPAPSRDDDCGEHEVRNAAGEQFDQIAGEPPETRKRALLVGACEPAVDDNVRDQDRRKLPGFAHCAPPGPGPGSRSAYCATIFSLSICAPEYLRAAIASSGDYRHLFALLSTIYVFVN